MSKVAKKTKVTVESVDTLVTDTTINASSVIHI